MQSPLILLLQGTVLPANPATTGSPPAAANTLVVGSHESGLDSQLPSDAAGQGFLEAKPKHSFAGIYAGFSDASEVSADSDVALGADGLGSAKSGIGFESGSRDTEQIGLTVDYKGSTLPQTGSDLPLSSYADSTRNALTELEGVLPRIEPAQTGTLSQWPSEKMLSTAVQEIEPTVPIYSEDRQNASQTADVLVAESATITGQTLLKSELVESASKPDRINAKALTQIATAEVLSSPYESAEFLQPENKQPNPQASSVFDTAAEGLEGAKISLTTDKSQVVTPALDTIETAAPTRGLTVVEQNLTASKILQSPALEQASSIVQFIARARQNQELSLQTTAIDPATIAETGELPVLPPLPGLNLSKTSPLITGVAQSQETSKSDPRLRAAVSIAAAGSSRRNGAQQVNLSSGNTTSLLTPSVSSTTAAEMMIPNTASVDQSLQELPDSQSDLAPVARRVEPGVSSSNGLAPGSSANKFHAPDGPLSFKQAGWSEALSQRITLLHGKNIEQAQIQLDPPELGPLQVKITMQGDQVSVQFTSAHGVVREALDHTSQRLAQLFNEEGIDLLDVSVSDGKGESDQRTQSQGEHGEDIDAETALTDENLTQLAIARRDIGQIDYFV